MAEKVGRIIRDRIPDAAADFVETQRMLLLGHRDEKGRVRAALLTGRPGFARSVGPGTLEVDGPSPPPGEGAILAIDFARRFRTRLNGTLEPRPGGFFILAKEVYSNCPKYIQARVIEGERPVSTDLKGSSTLSDSQRALVRRADTFFMATVPGGHHADVAHRGGNPRFVRIDGNRLAWDDYVGNAMFNTLGNLELDPEVALLFVDWQGGTLLHLNGRARVIGDKERVVEVEIAEVTEMPGGHPFRWSAPRYSPFNPR
jgi:hypothetical protein